MKPYKPTNEKLKKIVELKLDKNERLGHVLLRISPLECSELNLEKKAIEQLMNILFPFTDEQMKRMDLETKELVKQTAKDAAVNALRKHIDLYMGGCFTYSRYLRERIKYVMLHDDEPEFITPEEEQMLVQYFAEMIDELLPYCLLPIPNHYFGRIAKIIISQEQASEIVLRFYSKCTQIFRNFNSSVSRKVIPHYVDRFKSGEMSAEEIEKYRSSKMKPLTYYLELMYESVFVEKTLDHLYEIKMLALFLEDIPKTRSVLSEPEWDMVLRILLRVFNKYQEAGAEAHKLVEWDEGEILDFVAARAGEILNV